MQFHSPKQEKVTRGQIRQVRTLQDHSHISSAQKLLLHLSLNNLGTNCTDICHTPKSSTRIFWHISHKRPNLAGNSKTVLSLVYVKDFVNILQIFVCVTCECSQSSSKITPHLNWDKHSKAQVFTTALSPKAPVSILCILDSVFQSLKLNLTQMHCSFIRQLQVVLKKHYIKHLPKSDAKLMAAKLTTHT